MKPPRLLTQNSELKKDGVFNWTLPAFVVKMADGKAFNVCPNAGVCASVCYARNGAYNFPMSRAKHMRHLRMVLDDLNGWQMAMTTELTEQRYRGGKYVRIHDAGDFFSDEYTRAWIAIALATPDVIFYAYTKEVAKFKRLVEGFAPPNFRWLYSTGGREDALIDRERDRHAEIFPSLDALIAAGYTDQAESDILAVTLPTNKIGIVANKIRSYQIKQGERTFSQMQSDVRAKSERFSVTA